MGDPIGILLASIVVWALGGILGVSAESRHPGGVKASVGTIVWAAVLAAGFMLLITAKVATLANDSDQVCESFYPNMEARWNGEACEIRTDWTVP